MIVGHIGVRKGSKGVPGKNFRDLLGKPLIDWSLDQLLAHRRTHAGGATAAGADHRHLDLLAFVLRRQDRRCGQRSASEQG